MCWLEEAIADGKQSTLLKMSVWDVNDQSTGQESKDMWQQLCVVVELWLVFAQECSTQNAWAPADKTVFFGDFALQCQVTSSPKKEHPRQIFGLSQVGQGAKVLEELRVRQNRTSTRATSIYSDADQQALTSQPRKVLRTLQASNSARDGGGRQRERRSTRSRAAVRGS